MDIDDCSPILTKNTCTPLRLTTYPINSNNYNTSYRYHHKLNPFENYINTSKNNQTMKKSLNLTKGNELNLVNNMENDINYMELKMSLELLKLKINRFKYYIDDDSAFDYSPEIRANLNNNYYMNYINKGNMNSAINFQNNNKKIYSKYN